MRVEHVAAMAKSVFIVRTLATRSGRTTPWWNRHPLSALALIGLAATAGCGTTQSATAPSSTATPEVPSSPPTYSADAPGVGQVVLRFVKFQPARGAQLVPGEGAFIMANVEVPDQKLMLDVWVEAWDGHGSLITSFWPRGSAKFVCPSGLNRTSKEFLVGYDHSRLTTYPTASDPDVPFVRVQVTVRSYEQACAPPNIIPNDTTPPIIDVVERLDWHRAR